ncbi:MAG: NADH-quinone oxidoreductase subunit L [Chloroflexi bacterium]|nr:NADH-quinone oxidoreductase subunit L [Chloroflexota bacterium]
MTIAGLLILLVIGLAWLGAIVVSLVGDNRPQAQNALAVGFSLASAAAALLLLAFVSDAVVIRLVVGGVFGDFTFVADGMGVFLTVVATSIGSLAVIFSTNYMHGERQLGRYYGLMLAFIGTMAGLVLSHSLLLMFFFWEITALCSYALISFENDNPDAVKGGLKALVITQIGGVGLLVGAMIAFVNVGSYQFADVLGGAESFAPGMLAVMGFGFLLAAAAKSAQVPFHSWLPGAMEAPTPISALIHAATMVNAGVYLLARFFPLFEEVVGWESAVMVVGMTTALLAAIMALFAFDLKRVLAYSTVSQLGYMVYAVGVGGVFASQFHLLSHAIFKALLFLGAGAVIHAVHTRDMRQMGGLGKEMPFTRAVFVIGSLALVGLPIFNGFWSKDMILEVGLADGPLWSYIVMLIGAGLTAFYSFRMVWMVFYGEKQSEVHAHPAAPAMRIAFAPLAVGATLSGFLVAPFGVMLEASLPFHHLHIVSLGEMVIHTLEGAVIVMPVVIIGLAIWGFRRQLSGLTALANPLRGPATTDFGFDLLNDGIAGAMRQMSVGLRNTQTGHLGWNIFGILAGFIAVLIILVLGVD